MPVYAVDANNEMYLVGDTPEAYTALQEQNHASRNAFATAANVASLDGEETVGFSDTAQTFGPNNLYLELLCVTNGIAAVVLHRAQTNQPRVYELLTKHNLADPLWTPEQPLLVTNQSSILTTVPMLDRTNSLFLWAQDWTGIDSDADSLADWWEYDNFGGLDQTANGNYDNDDLSNYQEYGRGLDPNTIIFDVNVENSHVNAGGTIGGFSVESGVPARMAVLVDNPNFAMASWMPYASTVPVDLGSTDGARSVWIGLKGRASASQGSWERLELTRDTAPPLIVITNPVGTTLSQPVIQLQGYSPEALSKVRYDITNAMGLRTNKDGYVTKQWFDTNLFAFTTNWFECLDIQLTNGANLIVLYATDLAGNVRTNTYTYVLDYSGDSSPPSIGISWPQNGAEISGTSFTLRGSVDDATANMVVQMTGTNGVTNVANGLVERNGNFWVENLPLGGGTSSLVITATDAAGNSCFSAADISRGSCPGIRHRMGIRYSCRCSSTCQASFQRRRRDQCWILSLSCA